VSTAALNPRFFIFKAQFLSFNEAMERIIHGTVVDISDFPYQVALVSHKNHRKHIICGGALVRATIIFTAAHCTHTGNDEERENLSVLVGANYLNDPNGRFHEIDSVTKHPDFSYHDLDKDFSVIILKEPVEFDHKARNIDISQTDHEGGTVATISGWGRTEFGIPSKYLRATKLTVENWHKCQDYFPGIFHPKITRNMICVRPSRTSTYFVSCNFYFVTAKITVI
jgi:secreted trypsin-like serine protease